MRYCHAIIVLCSLWLVAPMPADSASGKPSDALSWPQNIQDNVYFRINGTSGDYSPIHGMLTTPSFFAICDQKDLACFGTLRQNGFASVESEAVLPFGDLYPGPHFDIRLGRMLVAFSNSSQNWRGKCSHHNLGLQVNMRGYFLDIEQGVHVPIRYQPHKNMGCDIPDQADAVTFDVTVRRIREFNLPVGQSVAWTFKQQSGEVEITQANTVTIRGLKLDSANGYSALQIVPIEPAHSRSIVYTRQPRHQTPISEPGRAPIADAANWQNWYDGALPNRFTESDVVLDDLLGTQKVIFDCTTDPRICAAHDARVSHDASEVMLTVAYGDNLHRAGTWANGPATPPIEFNATRFELWVHNIATGENTLLEKDARMGEYGHGNDIYFASSRAGYFTPWAHHGNEHPYDQLNIWKGQRKGNTLTDLRNLTPHGFSMNPTVLANGRVTYAIFEGSGDRGKTHTPRNNVWINEMLGNGTQHRTILGAHGCGALKVLPFLVDSIHPVQKGVGSTECRLLRPAVEIKKDYIAVGNYYGQNHQGPLGMLFGFEHMESEGYLTSSKIPDLEIQSEVPGSSRFAPNIMVMTPYGTDGDDQHKRHKNGKLMGKAGFAAPSSDGEYLFTHCRGMCYTATMPEQTFPAYTGGEPSSKREIRKAFQMRITDPFDEKQSKVIACKENKWNCFDAREITTYQSLFGQPEPAASPPYPTGNVHRLQIVDIRKPELFRMSDFSYRTPAEQEQDPVSFMGNADKDYAEKVHAIRVDYVWPWTTLPPKLGFARTEIAGYFEPEADGSLGIDLICHAGASYQVRGVDKDLNVIATDNTLRPLTCETETCYGCHDGHSEERREALVYSAEYLYSLTLAYKAAVSSPKEATTNAD